MEDMDNMAKVSKVDNLLKCLCFNINVNAFYTGK